MSPSDDGVDGHIFLTTSSVYKIPSLISNDDLFYPYKILKDVLSFDKH
jgi:hypothetical protein